MSMSAMTTPDFTYDPWERYVMAAAEVEERKTRILRALNADEIPYALIGGMAVAEWVATKDDGAVRTTKDTDLLLERNDLDRARLSALKVGLEYHFVDNMGMFLKHEDPRPKMGVHLVWANEVFREDDLLPTPSVSRSIVFPSNTRVLCLEDLIGMKLMAFRLYDRVHLADMFNVGLWDASWLSKYPPALAARLKEIVDNPAA